MTGTLTEFRMPSLGADMESGVLLEWLVHPGDEVHKGDIVAVVDTSKAAVEVECFADGTVLDLLVEPGTRVPVGEVLATIAAGGVEVAGAGAAARGPAPGVVESPLVRRLAERLHVDTHEVTGTGPGGRVTHADILGRAQQPTPGPRVGAAPVTEAPGAGERTAPRAPAGRVKASPLARRLAGELQVDLTAVSGTGPDASITADDVRRAAALTETPEAARAEVAPRAAGMPAATRDAAMRATIANLMARSKREIPHYYLTEQIDLGTAMRWMRERNRALPVSQRLLPAVLLLRATARAAVEVPELNGYWIDDRFVAQDSVRLGVATALRGGGLVAPAIADAASLDLAQLMAALRDLVARTRAGRLRGSEIADPTITVSSLGDQGAESIIGVIYPPQVALVGFGRVVERPWAVDGLIGVRPVVTASLAADHRATDGATGSRFLQIIAELLQQPEEL